jgi:hypothetical protein
MQGCVLGSDAAQFTFGEGVNTFGFDVDAKALRGFVTLATQALQEMDERHAREETDEAVSDATTALVVAGDVGR